MPLLTEQKLRLAIREEIENLKEYKNLSPRQKQMLEEGILQKVAGAVGKLAGKAAGALQKFSDKAIGTAMLKQLETFEKIKTTTINYFNNIAKSGKIENAEETLSLTLAAINSSDPNALKNLITQYKNAIKAQ